TRAQDTVKAPAAQAKPEWPILYEPSAPLPKESLTRDFLGPWAGLADPGPEVRVLHVSRQPSGADSLGSLEAACAAAPAGRLSVIEIDDNGPIFQAPVAVADRSLVVRAGKGYRPLLVWDEGRAAKQGPPALLALAHGSLTLERLDVVAKWTEAAAAGRPF